MQAYASFTHTQLFWFVIVLKNARLWACMYNFSGLYTVVQPLPHPMPSSRFHNFLWLTPIFFSPLIITQSCLSKKQSSWSIFPSPSLNWRCPRSWLTVRSNSKVEVINLGLTRDLKIGSEERARLKGLCSGCGRRIVAQFQVRQLLNPLFSQPSFRRSPRPVRLVVWSREGRHKGYCTWFGAPTQIDVKSLQASSVLSTGNLIEKPSFAGEISYLSCREVHFIYTE